MLSNAKLFVLRSLIRSDIKYSCTEMSNSNFSLSARYNLYQAKTNIIDTFGV
jgi:hypothetical protein